MIWDNSDARPTSGRMAVHLERQLKKVLDLSRTLWNNQRIQVKTVHPPDSACLSCYWYSAY